jgi:stage II sporulation protein D
MKKYVLLLWFLFSFLCYPPNTFAQDNLDKEHSARWHINYASYLIDVGKYLEALESYETASELTAVDKTKIDALVAKATLLSAFLDASEDALKVYRQVRTYPQAAEMAQYREGLLLFELNRLKEAKEVLKDYLDGHPYGRFRFQAEALLREIEKAVAPPPPEKVRRPEVRVRLCKTTGETSIEGVSVCAAGLGCKKNFVVKASDGNIVVNGRAVGERQIVFESKEPISITCGKKKKRVRGKIMAKAKGPKLIIINVLDIEDYLLGVVPSESIASWPIDTLKAQAVAARTYAYYQRAHREDWDYDLVDDEGDQAYKGLEREHPRSNKAVRETIGMILRHDGRTILAMYSANSGGYTADAKAVFNLHKPYLVAHPDPESLKGQMAQWTRKFTVSEVEKALSKRKIKVRGLKTIEAAERGPSGRIVKVRLISDDAPRVLRNRTTVRRALKLPEILFKIYRDGDHFVFQGKGFGHGVGYSQWGSAYMGKTSGYKQILSFYYPGTSLEKMW